MEDDRFRHCLKCGALYDWHKSSSRYRKMSFCSFSHERASEGFLIEDLFRVERLHPHEAPEPFRELVGRP